MNKAIVITTGLALILLLTVGLTQFNQSPQIETPVISTNSNLLSMINNQECTNQQAASCAVFIAEVIKSCVTAMQTGGADIIADIRCARARKLINQKRYCLPCLCEKIKEKGWDWVECKEKFI